MTPFDPMLPLWLLCCLLLFGTLLVPDVGEVKLLDRMLRDSGGENLTLKLFTSNTTPAEAASRSRPPTQASED